jgi:hypothetical protein
MLTVVRSPDLSQTNGEIELLKKVLTGIVYAESSDLDIQRRPGRSPKSILINTILRLAAARGIRLVKRNRFDLDARIEGRDWPGIAYTMVGLKRLDNVQMAIETVLAENIPGDVCECGVWRGGVVALAAAILKERNSDRLVWAADSFEGLPKPDAAKYPADDGYDMSEIDYLSAPLESVKANLDRLGVPQKNIRFLKGWFKNTLPRAPIERLAILRADSDLYESTIDVLKNLYHKVSPGGFVIIDDYGDWEPCRKAVTEFRESHNITAPIIPIDSAGAYWRKAQSTALHN